jgi:single-strand DNA-binding protein
VYETYVTVTGVVASDPRDVQLDDGRRIVSFRLASTSRRRDRAGEWTDGPTTWLTVTCWRGLAANVAESVGKGDRVIVHGRLRSREWTAADGAARTTLEVEADSLGHDLSFGVSTFRRVRHGDRAVGTSTARENQATGGYVAGDGASPDRGGLVGVSASPPESGAKSARGTGTGASGGSDGAADDQAGARPPALAVR